MKQVRPFHTRVACSVVSVLHTRVSCAKTDKTDHDPVCEAHSCVPNESLSDGDHILRTKSTYEGTHVNIRTMLRRVSGGDAAVCQITVDTL